MSELQIRHALADEHEQLRALRLASLAADPDAFGSTYERDLTHPPEFWERWARESELGETQRTFIVAGADGAWLGLALVRLVDQGAELNAMWVNPSARGQRAAGRLCDACAAWAASRGVDELTLRVVVSNEPARRAYESAGFTITDRTTWTHGDRTLEEFVMVRRLT